LVANGNREIKEKTMNTLSNENISGVTVTINGTPYTYEAHTLDKVAEILGGSQAILTDGSRIESITVNYFNA
jgi:hypothetical protein